MKNPMETLWAHPINNQNQIDSINYSFLPTRFANLLPSLGFTKVLKLRPQLQRFNPTPSRVSKCLIQHVPTCFIHLLDWFINNALPKYYLGVNLVALQNMYFAIFSQLSQKTFKIHYILGYPFGSYVTYVKIQYHYFGLTIQTSTLLLHI